MSREEVVDIFSKCGLKICKDKGYSCFRQKCIIYSYPQLYKYSLEIINTRSKRWKSLITVVNTELKKKNTHEFILKTSDYSLEKFEKKTRNRLRKSIQNCTFKRPTLTDLEHYGLIMHRQTFERQSRSDKTFTDTECWHKYISGIYNHEGFIIYGAYRDEIMIGYIVAFRLEEKWVIQHAFINRDEHALSPMCGLIYTLVNKLVEENGEISISYGIESFIPLRELNRFKCNMLFQKVPITRVYVVNPLILPAIKTLLYFLVHLLKKRNFKSSFVRNLITLYQGHRLLYYKTKTG